jgi:hypothetical protein
MQRILYSAILPLCAGGAFLIMAQQAEAACTSISATSDGVVRLTVTERAEAKLNRAIDRYAREGNVKAVRVRTKGTSCSTTQLATQKCTASAYVCR